MKYPPNGNLLLSNDTAVCYTDVPISQKYTTTGVDADYILFPSVRPTEDGVVAYALACLIDSVNRPVAGHINVTAHTIFLIFFSSLILLIFINLPIINLMNFLLQVTQKKINFSLIKRCHSCWNS